LVGARRAPHQFTTGLFRLVALSAVRKPKAFRLTLPVWLVRQFAQRSTLVVLDNRAPPVAPFRFPSTSSRASLTSTTTLLAMTRRRALITTPFSYRASRERRATSSFTRQAKLRLMKPRHAPRGSRT